MILLGGDLDDDLRDLLASAGLDTLAGAMAFSGGQDLDKPNLNLRRRTRLVLTDRRGREHVLYMKRYARPSAGQRLRRILRGEWMSPARREFLNIQAVRSAGVATMREVVCGEGDSRCGGGASYVIVTSVPGEALERCGEALLGALAGEAMAEFTADLAKLVRSLHAGGLCHRDLYASHVFADAAGGRAELYLIDMARVFRPRWRQFRWRVKDLAQLKYSMPVAWVDSQWGAFLSAYLGEGGGEGEHFDRAIDRKVAAMRRRNR